MVGVRNRAGGVDDSVPPESLEDFVRPTPKQDRVEVWDVLRGRFGLLLIRYDPVQVPIGSAKYPSAVTQLNITMRRAWLICCPRLAGV